MSTATDRQKLSPPMIAKAWGVTVHKVISWIKTGQLVAINAARKPDGKPRYLVDIADLEAFERARSTVPDGKPARVRRPRDGDVTKYF